MAIDGILLSERAVVATGMPPIKFSATCTLCHFSYVSIFGELGALVCTFCSLVSIPQLFSAMTTTRRKHHETPLNGTSFLCCSVDHHLLCRRIDA